MINLQLMKNNPITQQMKDHFAQLGYSELAGEVFGHLLIVDPPYRDLSQLRTELQQPSRQLASALDDLLKSGLIVVHPVAGNPRDNYKVDVKGWLDRTKEHLRMTKSFLDIIDQAVVTNQDAAPSPFNTDLKLAVRFHEELDEFLENFIRRWEFNHEFLHSR